MNPSDLSILLVEPSSVQQKIIVSHLKEAGVASIDTANNGEEALKLVEKYPPDLVISAMYLPDMSATELLTTIGQFDTEHDINFMLVSSETNFSALDPLRQAGIIAILPKPFVYADLDRALRTTLDYITPEEIALKNYDVTDLNVLVVDDSSMSRKHLSRVLTNMGISKLTTAVNGLEAIEKIEADEFDLIITDFNMPEMDGQQLIEYVRTEMGNTFTPIMMVTSEENETRLGNVHQAGVSAICDKPFDPQTLREILFRILDDHT
jgi:two-component system, chemotaxis family, chemotaxis protein CheY